MRYKLYEAPSFIDKIKTGFQKVDNKINNLGKSQYEIQRDSDKNIDSNNIEDRIHEIEKSDDITRNYRAYRDLLKLPNIDKSTEYHILDNIRKLFHDGFTRNWSTEERNRCWDLFNKITASVTPVGYKGQGMEYGLQQLGFWLYLIEAYKWEEILNDTNVFKQVVRSIINGGKTDIGESLVESEVQTARRLPQNRRKSNLQNTTNKNTFKIDNFKDFQKLYNMYARHELDNLHSLNDLSSKVNSADNDDDVEEQVNNVLDMLDDADDDLVKSAYKVSKGILMNRGISVS